MIPSGRGSIVVDPLASISMQRSLFPSIPIEPIDGEPSVSLQVDLRDRPIRIIYSRVNHNRHGYAIRRLEMTSTSKRVSTITAVLFPFFFFLPPFLLSFPRSSSSFFIHLLLPAATIGRRRVFLT